MSWESRSRAAASAPPARSAAPPETPNHSRTAGRPGDGLQLRVLEEPVVPVLTADAGVLVAAEGAPQMRAASAAVEADRSRLHLLGDLVGAHGVGVPDRRGESVPAVIGDADPLLLAVEANHDADGPEALVLGNRPRAGDVGEGRGLE